MGITRPRIECNVNLSRLPGQAQGAHLYDCLHTNGILKLCAPLVCAGLAPDDDRQGCPELSHG